MKAAWLSLTGALVVVGCGSSGTGDKPANTAGSSTGGSGSAGSAGMTNGGTQNQSGSATGGANAGTSSTAGSAGSSSGGGGAGAGAGAGGAGGTGGAGGAGGGGGTMAKGFECPATSAAPVLTGLTPVRVPGVPPADDFNNMNNDFSNIEGDVWIGDALYVSEISATKGQQGQPPPGRVLKITADDKVTILLPDSGSNGLATNAAGELFGAIHKDGSISKLSLSGGAPTVIASMFMNARFDSPNDLTIHKNGTIYFSDPSWQAPTPPPQTATRAYRIPPGGQPVAIEPNVNLDAPNGVALSKNQDFLYIGGNQLKKYPVMADGSLGPGTTFVQGGKADGMAIDCADNLYAASGSDSTFTVYSPAGAVLGKVTVNGISQVTNLAFGGADHKTLYVSGQGGKDQKGLFKIPMNIAGFPN